MIKRKVLTVVLSLMLAAAALLGFTKTVRADGETFKFKGEDGQTLTYKVLSTADKTVEVSDGKMVPGEVVIPEKVKDAEGNEYTVVRVGEGAFDMYGDYWSNKTLTHITIPGTVKSIGARAFRYGWALGVTLSEGLEVIEDEAFLNCSAFGQIELPKSLKSIGDKAFYKCFCLTSVTIPESTTSIAGNAFTECHSLSSVTVDPHNSVLQLIDGVIYKNTENGMELILYPCFLEGDSYVIADGTTSIGDAAFFQCRKLKSVTIPDSVTNIGNRAFEECTSIENIKMSKNVKSINDKAFYNDFKLVNMEVPEGVTYIGNLAFCSCQKLQDLKIPKAVTYIGDGAYMNCFKLKDATIPDGVTSIGEETFSGCSGLESVDIPDSVTSIGDGAFEYCSLIKDITFPESLTSLGNAAFRGCISLESILVDEKNSTFMSIDGVLFRKGENGPELVAYPVGRAGASYETPAETVSIGSGAFAYNSRLTDIILTKKVKTIGERAFYCCENLERVSIPEGVTEIANRQFYYCISLESISIPGTVTSIGKAAFGFCCNLQSVSIPDSVTSIGDSAFYSCYSFESITIPGSVKYVGTYVFEDCYALDEIVVLPGAENVSWGFVEDCYATVYIPAYLGINRFNDAEAVVYEPLTFNGTDKQHKIILKPGKYKDAYIHGAYFFGDDDPVTFSVVPALGENESVADLFDKEDLDITVNSDGTYSFVLPLEGVVAKAELKFEISPKVTISGWRFGENANAPELTEGSNPGEGEVTFRYYTDADCTEETTPEGSGAESEGGTPAYAGDYYVKAYIAETDAYYGGEAVAAFAVEKALAPANLGDGAKPLAKDGLVCDTTALELVTAPQTLPDGYEKIEYSLNGTDWSESIPTGTEAGEYTVNVRYIADRNHTDFVGDPITVTIDAMLCTVIWTDSEGEELDIAEYRMGDPEAVTDIVPTMEEDEDYTYAFDHWEAVYDEDNVKIYMPSFRAIPKELYGVTGGVIEWKKGSGKNAGLTIKRALDDETCFGHFSGLEIDEIMLTINKDYTVKRGSTIITIMSAYLETLGEGDHKVKAVFDDGEVTAKMDILEADPTPSNTPTEVPTSTPIPTSTPTTEPTSTPTDTPEVILTPIPEPTSTPIPTPTPEIDPAPKTGDTGNVWIWAVLAVLASVSIGGALVERRMRGQNR